MRTLLILTVANLWVLNNGHVNGSGAPLPGSVVIHDCIRMMTLPCTVAGRAFVSVDGSKVVQGTFGNIHQAFELFPNGSVDASFVYSIKFARNLKTHSRSVIENEALVTDNIYFDVLERYKDENLLSLELTPHDLEYNWAPTIAPFFSAYSDSTEFDNIVMVMDHHPLGDVATLSVQTLQIMKRHPHGFVWKMLWDMSFVLSIFNNEYSLIDGDVKLKNMVVNGDLNNYTSTTFIKLDYGLTVHMDAARDHLSNPLNRRYGFFNFGTYVTPMDVRVLYGDALPDPMNRTSHDTWHDRLGKVAALKYGYELQSKDILGLAAAGLNLYNLLFPVESKILLKSYPESHDEKSRKEMVAYNWRALNEHYTHALYKTHTSMPCSIRTFLIKMHWLAYQQLPENDMDGAAGSCLKWQTFRQWLKHIFCMMHAHPPQGNTVAPFDQIRRKTNPGHWDS
eukprot:229203_1